VAEQLGLDQLLGDGGAVDLHQRPVAAGRGAMDGARRQLLAGAALAGDQDRGVGRRRLVDGLAELAHRGRRADQGLRLDAERAVLGAQARVLDGIAQRHEHALALQGLLEEVVGPQPGRLDRGGDVGVAAHHQDGHVVAALAHCPQHLDAVHLRHLDVEQHGIRQAVGDPRQRLRAAAGLLDAVPLVLEDHPEAVADRGLVVH
jgi:hypothetical protein